MNYYLLIRPVIGAGIGYITNWIAVKMLFRPLNPIKIGKLTLPFTPGIIPKNKPRIAEAIGDAISQNLLTEESLRLTLLSEEKKTEIEENIKKSLEKYMQENDITIKNFLCSNILEENLVKIESKLSTSLSESIFSSVKESNLGNIVSDQILLVANEKLKGSILGIFGGNKILSSLKPEISAKVDEYINEHGEEAINKMVNNEILKIENKTVAGTINSIEQNDLNLTSIIMKLYEKIILEKLPNLLETLNISKVVSDKINSMPTLELEKIILEIMKKELNALVNLGALIGFVLGLLNLLF